METVIIILTLATVLLAIPPAIDAVLNLRERWGKPMKTAPQDTSVATKPKTDFWRRIAPFCLIAFIICGLIVVLLSVYKARTFSGRASQIQPGLPQNRMVGSPAFLSQYQSKLAKPLRQSGYNYYMVGEYAFAVACFEKCYRFDWDGECWVNTRCIYATARLALSPTPEGHLEFHKMLNQVTNDIASAIAIPDSKLLGSRYLKSPDYISGIHDSLMTEVEPVLCEESEKKYVQSIDNQVLALKTLAQNKETNAP